MHAAREFFKNMAQGIDPDASQKNLLDEDAVNTLAHRDARAIGMDRPAGEVERLNSMGAS